MNNLKTYFVKSKNKKQKNKQTKKTFQIPVRPVNGELKKPP